MNSEFTGPILALILGWLLSEGSHFLRYRGEKKKAIRVALAELLEVRHRVISNQFLFEQIETHLSLPPSVIIQIRNSLPTPLQKDPDAPQRLNSAILEVAKYDPFLAYILRGKDIIGVIETALNPVAPQEDIFAGYLLKTQKDLRDHILPVLDSVILTTAFRSGLVDWVRAVRRVKLLPQVSEEVRESSKEFMDSIKEQLELNAKKT